MRYSLINVTSEQVFLNQKCVNGHWIQDFFGDLEQAKQLAQEIKEVNGNEIEIAVTAMIPSGGNPMLEYFTNLVRLA